MALPARHNPFAVENLHGFGYRDPESGEPADLDRLLERFDALGRRAALVGPKGTGKTTLLAALAERLAARGERVAHLRVREGGVIEELIPLGGGDPRGAYLLLDGTEALPRRAWWAWRRRARRADGLLVTAHRPGRLPTLVTTATTPRLLETLTGEVLAGAPAASRRESAGRTLPPAGELLARHRGNVRLALLELYDLYAGR